MTHLKKHRHKLYFAFFGTVAILTVIGLIIWKINVPMLLESTYLVVETGKAMLEELT
jgi:hypothetical protein